MFNINKAIEKEQKRAEMNGKKFTRTDLAIALWPNADKSSQRMNISKLCNGTTKRITPEMVDTICKVCHVSPNFLYRYEETD